MTNTHNARSANLSFHIPHAGVLHGFAGYFEAVLYENVGLSIHPERKDVVSKDMLSWFPLFFPVKVRLCDNLPWLCFFSKFYLLKWLDGRNHFICLVTRSCGFRFGDLRVHRRFGMSGWLRRFSRSRAMSDQEQGQVHKGWGRRLTVAVLVVLTLLHSTRLLRQRRLQVHRHRRISIYTNASCDPKHRRIYTCHLA